MDPSSQQNIVNSLRLVQKIQKSSQQANNSKTFTAGISIEQHQYQQEKLSLLAEKIRKAQQLNPQTTKPEKALKTVKLALV